MTQLYLNTCNLDKFLHQNKAELIDFFYGCLQDNALYSTKGGTMAIYEHYLNCWSSDLLIIFSRVESEIKGITAQFYERETANDNENT